MTAKDLGEQPAYPIPQGTISLDGFTGMTKREAFALAAMQAILQSSPNADHDSEFVMHRAPRKAIACADALLRHLANEQE